MQFGNAAECNSALPLPRKPPRPTAFIRPLCPPSVTEPREPKAIRSRGLRHRNRNVFDKRVKMVFFVARWNMKTTMTMKQGMLPDNSRRVGIWQHRCAFGIVGGRF
jgi:hypothetical protein